MKQLEVKIMGQSYLLACPDGDDALLLDAVEQVDTAMCKIRESGKVRARERIAVLAAINLTFDLIERQARAQAQTPVPQTVAADSPETSEKAMALVRRLDQALAQDPPAI